VCVLCVCVRVWVGVSVGVGVGVVVWVWVWVWVWVCTNISRVSMFGLVSSERLGNDSAIVTKLGHSKALTD
jgi:hypothetical protein